MRTNSPASKSYPEQTRLPLDTIPNGSILKHIFIRSCCLVSVILTPTPGFPCVLHVRRHWYTRHSNTHSRQLHPGCTELPSGSCGRPKTTPLCASALHTRPAHPHAPCYNSTRHSPRLGALYGSDVLIKQRTLGLWHFVSGHTFDYPFYAVLCKYLQAVSLVDFPSNKSNW